MEHLTASRFLARQGTWMLLLCIAVISIVTKTNARINVTMTHQNQSELPKAMSKLFVSTKTKPLPIENTELKTVVNVIIEELSVVGESGVGQLSEEDKNSFRQNLIEVNSTEPQESESEEDKISELSELSEDSFRQNLIEAEPQESESVSELSEEDKQLVAQIKSESEEDKTEIIAKMMLIREEADHFTIWQTITELLELKAKNEKDLVSIKDLENATLNAAVETMKAAVENAAPENAALKAALENAARTAPKSQLLNYSRSKSKLLNYTKSINVEDELRILKDMFTDVLRSNEVLEDIATIRIKAHISYQALEEDELNKITYGVKNALNQALEEDEIIKTLNLIKPQTAGKLKDITETLNPNVTAADWRNFAEKITEDEWKSIKTLTEFQLEQIEQRRNFAEKITEDAELRQLWKAKAKANRALNILDILDLSDILDISDIPKISDKFNANTDDKSILELSKHILEHNQLKTIIEKMHRATLFTKKNFDLKEKIFGLNLELNKRTLRWTRDPDLKEKNFDQKIDTQPIVEALLQKMLDLAEKMLDRELLDREHWELLDWELLTEKIDTQPIVEALLHIIDKLNAEEPEKLNAEVRQFAEQLDAKVQQFEKKLKAAKVQQFAEKPELAAKPAGND